MRTGHNRRAVKWCGALSACLAGVPVWAQPSEPAGTGSSASSEAAIDDSQTAPVSVAQPVPPVPPGTASPTNPADTKAPGSAPLAPPQDGSGAPQPQAARPNVDGERRSVEPIGEQANVAPEPASAPGPEASGQGAKVEFAKGVSIETRDGKNKLVLGARVQPRLVWSKPDGQDASAAFELSRARFSLNGHVHSSALGYKFEADFGKGSVALKDFFVDYGLLKQVFHIRAGQFKKPFNRQQINSSGRLELVERAITDKAFGAGRDIGLMLHNNYEKSPSFEWALGFFNGTGDATHFSGEGTVITDEDGDLTTEVEVDRGKFSNVPSDWRPRLVARAGYNHGGIKGYSETDFEGGPFRAGVAASVQIDLDTNDDGLEEGTVSPEVDLIIKAFGFSASSAVYYLAPMAESAPTAIGFYAQAGYLIGGAVQPVARIAFVDPEGETVAQREITFGLSYYPWQHLFKWQTDIGLLTSTAAGETETTDLLLRSQLQLAF